MSEVAGNHWTFLVMVGVILVWALTGPIFNFSDSWQLFINFGDYVDHIPHGLHHPEHPEP
jgi:low affinity Fe/Cu permease